MEDFLKHIKEVAAKFKLVEKKPIKLIGNIDSDGITATSIMISVFLREDLKFSVSIIKQITPKIISEIKHEPYNTIVFVDLGSGYLTQLEEHLPDKNIFILDHHIPDKKETKFHHVNPHMFMIDGGKEVSAAGVSYLFARALNQKNIDLAYLAIIGAIGDVQENQGFEKLNKHILEDALLSKKVEVKTGLRLYGMQTKPVHKVLEYSTNPYIPNVTGSETGAILFLQELGINIQENGKFRKFANLTEDEIKKVVTAIILRRMGSESNPEDVFGPIYLLPEEPDESPTKDMREFSTLIN
ncbi:DHH family phosphoesterase, partial [Candidatus Woesearchaeota archaeon]|nr:DHH family phosphoesterase [Candidatus Woesearchaeota archaeon]